jgi:hypothetical protein
VPKKASKKIQIKQKGKKGYLYFLLLWQWQPKNGEKKEETWKTLESLKQWGLS